MHRSIINQLKQWKECPRRNPLIIKGARQIGKTYTLKHFGENYYPRYHYFNFEDQPDLCSFFESDLKPKRIINDLNFYTKHPINIEQDLVIFDEIQYCPKAITSLKYFQENLPQLDVCSAGSLLGLELETYSFPVGKVDFLNMFPMSFTEFLAAIDEENSLDLVKNFKPTKNKNIPEAIHKHLWKQLQKYFIVGGLPKVVLEFAQAQNELRSAFEIARAEQKRLSESYLADIAKHSGKQNSMHIERLWRNIPSQLAREQSGSAPKFKLKGQIPGVKGYAQIAGVLDWLSKAGTVIKVPIINNAEQPLSAYATENSFKLFMFDIGLLGSIANLSPQVILDYDFGTYKGYLAENFVAQELAYSQSSSEHIYSWKKNTAEVEFLKEKDCLIIPIEVKSGWATQAKSLKVFADRYDSPYRVILSARNLTIDQENKVHRYPLYLASKIE